LVFAGLWFDIHAIMFWLPSEKYKIVLWKKKTLKTSKISLFSFRLCFIIVGQLIYLYHVLFNAINISWYCFKKEKQITAGDTRY
jgi:hypothetical protein